MALIEMVMPKMGESVMEGTILKWLKQPGDTIEEEESVLEVATDKVDTEVPASSGGVLKEILANEGDVVKVDHPIAIIEVSNGAAVTSPDQGQRPSSPAAPATAQTTPQPPPVSQATTTGPVPTPTDANNGFYSPLVLNIAKEENIPVSELAAIKGTGKDQRLTKRDLLEYLKNRTVGQAEEAKRIQVKTPSEIPTETARPALSDTVSVNGSDELMEMDRMRRMIAERMVESKRTSPHVTSFVEADLTEVVTWRNKIKAAFKQRHGQSFTFTPIFVQAIVKAIQDFPMINIEVSGHRIIKKKAINIGMAVALPNGNLIVPVIHHADHLSLTGLALKVNDLAQRARENKLKPDELQGGTYTISNVGTFGNVMGTPIIVQPQVGIMAFGAIRKKPAVIETPQGDFIGIKQTMFLSHSYDHRVVDGSLGGMFVRRVADYLEGFDTQQSV